MRTTCPKVTNSPQHKGTALTIERSPIVLTERDRQLIAYVACFRLVRRDQAMALAPFWSLTRLAALVAAHLLSRKLLPVYPGKGSAQALYYLGKEAGGLVNMEPSLLKRYCRQMARWDLRQADHVLTANQVVVDFLAGLARRVEDAAPDFRTEHELRETFHDRNLVPDGWLAWTANGKRFNVFVEVDLSTEGLGAWRRKVVSYQQYADHDAHREYFNLRSFRVLVVAPSRARLRNLRQVWTRGEDVPLCRNAFGEPGEFL